MKHVVLYVGHLYKLFWTKKIDQVGREGQGRSKYCPKWASFLASEPSLGPEMGQGPLKWTQINQGQLEDQFYTMLGVGESIHHRLVTNVSRAPARNNIHS